MARQRVTLISVSGIDGAGKSTLIHRFRDRLMQAGAQVEVYSFWDRVAVFPRLRECLSRLLFKGEQGIGSPDKPVNRRDKNVRAWYMTAVRPCLYLLDAVCLRRVVTRVGESRADVVIFDRYIYDELANLSFNKWWVRPCICLLLKLASEPDIAYLLDADPDCARARKPEYPPEFLHHNRAAYLALSQQVPVMAVIGPLTTPEAGEEAVQSMMRDLSLLAPRNPTADRVAISPRTC